MSDAVLEHRPPTPFIVSALTAALVAAYAAYALAPVSAQNAADYAFAVIPLRFNPASPDHFRVWWEALGPIFGHGFLHGGWVHVGVNAFFLFGAGRIVARRLGALGFVMLYAAATALGALMYVALNWNEASAAVGASDGVCGVLLAYFLAMRADWREALRIPALRNQMLTLIGLNVVVMGALSEAGVFPIAWEGHLGGFIGGFLAYVVLQKPRRAGPWG